MVKSITLGKLKQINDIMKHKSTEYIKHGITSNGNNEQKRERKKVKIL